MQPIGISSMAVHSVVVLLLFAFCLAVMSKIAAYFFDDHGLRAYPGPPLAKFTDLWMFWTARRNCWSEAVDVLHREYGPFVRLSPNHVSISDPKALPVVYGHSAGFTKAGFYDVFVNRNIRNIFNTRSRQEHARKRRMESHMFAPQSIRDIEPISQTHVSELLRQWDYLVSRVHAAGEGGPVQGTLGSTRWDVQESRVWMDCMTWISFWAFDTIGDLAFGLPFGMLKAGKDTAKVAKSLEQGMQAIATLSDGTGKLLIEEEEIPCIETLSTRAEANISLAWLSASWRSFLERLPPFRSKPTAVAKLVSLSASAVARRVANPNPRQDMLQKLLEARDEDGKPLSPEELSAESFVLIAAGSDTIANTTCATTYYLARDQRVQATLQTELDQALASVGSDVAPYNVVKDLPYLDAVIMEGQRMYSTVGAGLPREVPAGGATILGRHFKEGTWVSVPLYHLHHDEAVWGPDAAEFRPERWVEASPEKKREMMSSFAPFSVGPRACIGRNLAVMQLHIILATLFHRYEMCLRSPDARLEVMDALVRRPLECIVGVKRRST